MSKYIIDLNDKDKEVCEKYVNCELGDELSDYVNVTELAGAIANGTPIDKGDLIMFNLLMTTIADKGLPFEEVLLLIDNAQTVLERPQGDLISRSALLNQIDTTDWSDVRLLVEDAPTVEPRDNFDLGYVKGLEDGKPKQGEWIVVKSPLSNETIVKCDKCGDEFIGNDVEDYNFCPICGADMQKGGAE